MISITYTKTRQFRWLRKLHSFRLQVQPMGGENAQDFSRVTPGYVSLRVWRARPEFRDGTAGTTGVEGQRLRSGSYRRDQWTQNRGGGAQVSRQRAPRC